MRYFTKNILANIYILGSILQLANILTFLFIIPEIKSIFNGVCLEFSWEINLFWAISDTFIAFWFVVLPLLVVWIKTNISTYNNLCEKSLFINTVNKQIFNLLILRAQLYFVFLIMVYACYARLLVGVVSFG